MRSAVATQRVRRNPQRAQGFYEFNSVASVLSVRKKSIDLMIAHLLPYHGDTTAYRCLLMQCQDANCVEAKKERTVTPNEKAALLKEKKQNLWIW
jgi:hypothetical protein